jgi:hypothetical protein
MNYRKFNQINHEQAAMAATAAATIQPCQKLGVTN